MPVTAVHAALFSAVIELRGQFANHPDRQQADSPDEDLASQLVRLAYNRARRQRRRDDRIQQQAARGEAVLGGAQERPLDGHLGVAHEYREIRAQLESLLGSIYEGLDSRDREILAMYAEGYTQEEVARRFGCHRSQVSRVRTWARHRFDRALQAAEE